MPNILDAFSETFIPFGLKLDGKMQDVCGITIYPNEIFCCYNFETLQFDITNDTISIHHFYASWQPLRVKIKNRLVKTIIKILGAERYLKIKRKIIRKGS